MGFTRLIMAHFVTPTGVGAWHVQHQFPPHPHINRMTVFAPTSMIAQEYRHVAEQLIAFLETQP